jgi:signal peptidase I
MLRLLKVAGDSLLPRYREGDFVLVSRIPFLLGRLGPGDVVAFRHPDHGTMIKVVDVVAPDGECLTVLGTHPRSIDSRHFGPVGRRDLIGAVLWHLKRPAAGGVTDWMDGA